MVYDAGSGLLGCSTQVPMAIEYEGNSDTINKYIPYIYTVSLGLSGDVR